jgi:hypothetical protein
MMPRRHLLALLLPVVVAACGTETKQPDIAPPTPTTDTTSGGGGPAPRRTVGVRNPFGRALADNLILDGDFELTGRSGQMPWQSFGQSGNAGLNYETGGRCRSGVKCGKIAEGETLLGYMSQPRAGVTLVTAWGKPASGACGDLSIQIYDMSFNKNVTSLAAATPGLDETGWCKYEGSFGAKLGAGPVIFASTRAGAAVVDDFVALPATSPSLPKIAGPPPTQAELDRYEAISDWVRRHRPHDAPPVSLDR